MMYKKELEVGQNVVQISLTFPSVTLNASVTRGENHSLPSQPAVTRFLPVPSPSPGTPPTYMYFLSPFRQANCYPSFKTQLQRRHVQRCKHAFSNTGSFPLSPVSPQLDKVCLLSSLLSLPAIVIRLLVRYLLPPILTAKIKRHKNKTCIYFAQFLYFQ